MDEITLRRAQKGDAAAFEQLMTPYEGLVWRVCWHYTRSREDAADCAQEVMLKAWRSLPQYRKDCSLESWLYRICMSCCTDFLRRRQRRPETPVEELPQQADSASAPEIEALRRESTRELRQALDSLPEEMRTVLILYALEDRRYEDIAQITGVAVGTVKSRLSRARQKLAEILAARGNNPPFSASNTVKGGR